MTPWTVAHQAPLSMGFSRQKYWSGLPFHFPGNLPNPGIKPGSPACQVDSLPSELVFLSSLFKDRPCCVEVFQEGPFTLDTWLWISGPCGLWGFDICIHSWEGCLLWPWHRTPPLRCGVHRLLCLELRAWVEPRLRLKPLGLAPNGPLFRDSDYSSF